MFGGLTRLLIVAVAVGVFLTAPSVAFACNDGVSAENVYKECLPNGGGGKPTSGAHTTHTSSGPSAPTSSTPISKGTKKAIKRSGSDRRVISALVRNFGPRSLPTSDRVPATAPSAIGSAFDLGSGPTALLVALAATAFLLLATAGTQGLRRRRR
jgi:hypothetical protein